MSLSSLARLRFPRLIIALWVGTQGIGILAQQRGGTVQTDKVQPVNSGARVWLAAICPGRSGIGFWEKAK